MKKELEIIYNSLGDNILEMKGRSVLVTGALGMLSSYVIEFINYLNKSHDYHIKLILLARNEEKLKQRFPYSDYRAEYVICDISDEILYDKNIDYIFHFAGNSSPFHIKNSPLDIIKSNVIGTLNITNLAADLEQKEFYFHLLERFMEK